MTSFVEQPRLQAAAEALNVILPKSESSEQLQLDAGGAASQAALLDDALPDRASKVARIVRTESGLIKDRHRRSTRFPAVVVGCELVDWLVSNGGCTTRLDAVRLGQRLIDQKLLHHVYLDLAFQDGPEFYRFHDDEDPKTMSCPIALRYCSKAGLLSVKGSLGWHTRFCLVNPDTHMFYVYDTDSAHHPKHVVDLSGAETTVDDWIDAKHHHGTACCLTLSSSSGGSHVYAAQTAADCTDWIQSLVSAGAVYKNEEKLLHMAKSIFEFSAADIDGHDVPLDRYRGRVCLVVNVASSCGLTSDNYKQLEQLYTRHKDNGFEILAFPCNQFGHQESETCQRIKAFATQRFNIDFPMFEKVHVNGKDAHPLFKFLRHELTGVFTSAVKWNFTKFLCDRDGLPFKRYGPPTAPASIEDDIIRLLNQHKAG